MNNNNFFNSSNTAVKGVEIAILAEDIELPEVDTVPISYGLLWDRWHDDDATVKYYRSKEIEYKSEIGKFYIPILTPSINRDDIVYEDTSAPKVRSKSTRLDVNSYQNSNIILLEIPKYLVCEFTGKIPAGTQFLFVSLSSRIMENKFRIIGLYSSTYAPEVKRSMRGKKK